MTSAVTEAGRSHVRRHPPHDGDRDAAVLAHDELGRRRRARRRRRPRWPTSSRPPASGVPSQVDHGGHPGAPDGHVGDAAPPRPAEGVGDDHADVDAEGVLEPGPDAPGRAVRVVGQQRGRPVRHVGQVDAGVGADEAVAGLADHQVAAAAQDADRLLAHQGQLGRRVAVVDRDEPALGLGHDLLGDHDARRRRAARARRGGPARRHPAISAARSVARRHLADAGDREHRDAAQPSGIDHHPGQVRRPLGRAHDGGRDDAADPLGLDVGRERRVGDVHDERAHPRRVEPGHADHRRLGPELGHEPVGGALEGGAGDDG